MDFPRGVRPHGAGLQIRVQHKGRRFTQIIETSNPLSKRSIAAAVRAQSELASRLKLGLPVECGEDGSLLLSDVAAQYVQTLDVERSTAISYVRILNQHWLPNFGHWLLTDVRPSHIKAYLSGTELSPKTKRNILVPLRCVFNHALDDGSIDANPVSAVKVKKHQKPAIDRFSPDERERILAKLSGSALMYFTMMFETGMRPSEILALKWSDYDGQHIHVSKSVVWRRLKPTTKNHEARSVYASTLLREALQGHPTRFKGGYIFPNAHGEYMRDTDDFNAAWKVALERARVHYRIPYVCRHTRAAMMLTGGIDAVYAAGQLGHTVEMFLRTYSTWINELGDKAQEVKLEALEKLGQQDKNGPEVGQQSGPHR